MVVDGWLVRAAAAHPRRTALDTPAGSWSYAELLAAARWGALQLSGRGARAGERVAIVMPPGLAFAQALHACLLLGAVAVPIDPRATPAERARSAAGAALLLDAPLEPAPARGVSEAAGAAGRARAGVGEGLGTGHDLSATAVVIHTSGSTAAPRPVELTYGNFLWSALGSAVALGLDPRERWLCALPVCHVGGLSILLRSAIYATTAVVHDGFDADRVLRALDAEQVTLVSLVATTLSRLLDAGLRDPPRLRWALTGGGPVPAALLDRARAAGVPISLTYGLTETCSQVTTGGPPLFCTRVLIAPDGEIMVAGPTVAPAAREPDGWLRTGDLGALDERGFLSVTGRKADTIISGGENVAPSEVEAVLEAHPEVLEAAVVGRSDPRWGEAVGALVVLRQDAAVDGEALRAHCARTLAPYKVPKQVTMLTGPLPRTPSGKLLRGQLAARLAAREQAR